MRGLRWTRGRLLFGFVEAADGARLAEDLELCLALFLDFLDSGIRLGRLHTKRKDTHFGATLVRRSQRAGRSKGPGRTYRLMSSGVAAIYMPQSVSSTVSQSREMIGLS